MRVWELEDMNADVAVYQRKPESEEGAPIVRTVCQRTHRTGGRSGSATNHCIPGAGIVGRGKIRKNSE